MTNDAQTVESATPVAGGNGQSGRPSKKKQMVAQALEALGNDARPGEIKDYVREHFGVEMSPSHISTTKSILLRANRIAKPEEDGLDAERRRSPDHENGEASPMESERDGALSLRDVKMVKELGDRLGAKKLRELVDLLFPVASSRQR